MLAALLQTIDPPNSIASVPQSEFGAAIATSPNYRVIGAPGADVSGVNGSGQAFVFDSNGALLHTLNNPAPGNLDHMGAAVAVSGNTVVVGAWADSVGGVGGAGRAFVFDAVSGALTASIDNPTPNSFDTFGFSVATSGGIVAVGSPRDNIGSNNSGVVHLFDASTGNLLRTINNPSPFLGDIFGWSIAMSGSTLVVGPGGSNVGQVYVFDASNGSLVHTITNPTPASFDGFGNSVAISGNRIVVGAYLDDATATDAGTAYVFDATTGSLTLTIDNPFPDVDDRFGDSVAVSGNNVVVGAFHDDTGASDSGAVYAFDATTGVLLAAFGNPTADADDNFSRAIAVTGDIFLAGTAFDDIHGTNQGVAHAFTLGPPPYNVALSSTDVAENSAAGTVVAILGTSPSSDPPYTYAFVNGAGGDDNSSFTIVGNELRTNATLDFETKAAHSILIKASDTNGILSQEVFTVNVTDVNEAPLAIILSSTQVPEFQPVGTVVGFLDTSDPDASDSFTYSLVSGAGDADNAMFAIVNNELRTSALFDFENRSSYSARIRSLDSGGLPVEQAFSIVVTDVNPLVPNAAPAFDLHLVADINDTIQSSVPTNALTIGGQAFFAASSLEFGNELYRTDGTDAGTYLVKDLLEGTESGSSRSLTEFNGELFFLSEFSYLDPAAPPGGIPETRTGLWKSDGTEAGTLLVKGFDPGILPLPAPGTPSPSMHVVNGQLLFFVGDSTTMEELWTSDGTELGTTMVESFFSSGLGAPIEMPTAVLGNLLLFNRGVDAFSGEHHLWRTDGTAGGTFELRMGEMGFGFSELDPSLTVVGSEVFFVSSSMNEGKELWKTDGTLAGTALVKDIAGPDDSAPANLTEVNGTLFFSADTSGFGSDRELWKSDGTVGGTTLVKDIWPGAFDSGIDTFSSVFISFNNTLYFSAQDGFNGKELWKSDGTAGGTSMVLDFMPGFGQGLSPENLVVLGSKLLFTTGSFSPDGPQLWETDGTAAGTMLVADIDGPGSSAASFSDFLINGSNAFFRGNNGTDGNELWVTDGTNGGTVQLDNLGPGSGSGLNSILTTGLGGVLFQGNDGVHGTELGVSDGTVVGTRLIDVARGTPSAEIQTVFEFGGNLFLSAQGDLWISDGTDAGTSLVKDFPSTFFGLTDFTEVDGELFFVAEGDSSEGNELWKTDGTTAGTVLVKDILSGSGDSDPEMFTSFNNALYFVADDGINGKELWRSFGNPENTLLFHEFVTGPADGEIETILTVGDKLFFVADDVLYNESFEVLHSQTSRNTFMPWDDLLYFSGFSVEHGYELWQTDGTQLGTYLVADILPGPDSSFPGGGVVGGEIGSTASGAALEAKLVFRALADTNNSQLFATDGSTNGTVQLTDVPIADDGLGNTASFTPLQLTKVGGQVYFEAFDVANGRELWVSNGTLAGTRFVKDLRLGLTPDPLDTSDPLAESPFFNIEELIAFRDRLIFRTADDATGKELWSSDGTLEGTGLGDDILAGTDSGNPSKFTVLGDNLFLTANTAEFGISNSPVRGGELFRLNEAPYSFDVAGTAAIDTPAALQLSGLDIDGDVLSFEIVDVPTNGTFSILGAQLTYTPNSGFTGVDQFTYRAFDGSLYSQTATVEVGVSSSTNTASFSLAGESISEQSGVHFVDVILAQPATSDLLIPYTIEGAVAIENGNNRVGELFIPTGDSTAQIIVALSDDARYETDPQLMELTLRSNAEIAIGAISQHILTLQDDDPMPTVMFVSPWQSVGESDDTLRINIGLSAASDEVVSIDVGIFGNQGATANVDYITASSTTVEFLPGQTNQAVLIRLVDDALAEQRELIFSQLQGTVVGATVTADPERFRHLTWIEDNDTSIVSTAPSVLFQTEGDVVTLEATRSGGNLAAAISIPVIVDQGGTSAADYSLSSLSFDFAANETTATIDVTIVDDGTQELFEALTVRLDDQSGTFTPGDGTSTYIGIYDNDQTTVSLSIGDTNSPGITSPTSLRERHITGEASWLIDVTATLTIPSSQTISVPVVVNNGSISKYAKPGSDFLFSTADFVFAPGETEVTRTLEIFDDILVERDEIIQITLDPTASQFGLRPTGLIDEGSLTKQVEIRDDETRLAVSNKRTTSERSDEFDLNFKLAEPAGPPEFFFFRLSGTATLGQDYSIPVNSLGFVVLEFGIGEQFSSLTFDIINDNIDERTEYISLEQYRFAAGGGFLKTGRVITVRLGDNDSRPEVRFSPRHYSASESQVLLFQLGLNRPSSQPVKITLLFRGSAKLGRDYQILNSNLKMTGNGSIRVVEFPPLATDAIIRIKALNVRGNKTVSARIVSAQNATRPPSFRGGLGSITILDRNRPPAAKSPSRPTSNAKINNAIAPPGTLAIDTDVTVGSIPLGELDISSLSNLSNNSFSPGSLAIGSGSQGRLKDATVFFDANFNTVRDFLDLDQDGRRDPDEPLEPEVLTDLDGSFAILIPDEFDRDGNGLITTDEGRLVIGGGLDISTNLPLVLPFTAPVGTYVINPVTTLTETLVRTSGFDIEDAYTRVGESLGIAGYDFTEGDATYGILAGDVLAADAYVRQVQISSAAIQLASFAQGATGLGIRLHADEAFSLMADRIAQQDSILDLSNEGLINDLVVTINNRLTTPLSVATTDGVAELIALGADRLLSLRLSDFTTSEDFLEELTRIKKLMHDEIASALSDVGSGTRTIANVLADYSGPVAPNFNSRAAAQIIGQVVPPVLGVSNGFLFEGNNGTAMMQFTVAIAGSHNQVVSVDYETFDDSAIAAEGDYTSVSGVLTWQPGDTSTRTIQVPISGDSLFEPDEEFGLLISDAQNAVIRLAEGIGFVLNDDELTHVAPATPGEPTDLTLFHSRDGATLLQGDEFVLDGEFADSLTATLVGQTAEANAFRFDFSAASYRDDFYTVTGGTATDSLHIDAGRFNSIVHRIADAVNSNGLTQLFTESDTEINIDWQGVENSLALVSFVDNLTIQFPLGVTDIQISDADPSTPGVMRISSASFQFAPFDFTVPGSSLVIVTEDTNAVVQTISTDPEFTGTIEHLQSAPQIEDILVGSTTWVNSAFIDAVDGAGNSGLGISLSGANQLRNLSWTNLDQVHIVFSEDVSAAFTSGNVSLEGIDVTSYDSLSSLSYNAVTNVGTITLSSPIANDALRLTIQDTLTDADGNSLDGEWTTGQTVFSGDGTAGGQFAFFFNVLPGDATGDGVVLGSDVGQIRLNQFAMLGDANYSTYHDINGSGNISGADVGLARLRQFALLPSGTPGSSGFAASASENLSTTTSVEIIESGVNVMAIGSGLSTAALTARSQYRTADYNVGQASAPALQNGLFESDNDNLQGTSPAPSEIDLFARLPAELAGSSIKLVNLNAKDATLALNFRGKGSLTVRQPEAAQRLETEKPVSQIYAIDQAFSQRHQDEVNVSKELERTTRFNTNPESEPRYEVIRSLMYELWDDLADDLFLE